MTKGTAITFGVLATAGVALWYASGDRNTDPSAGRSAPPKRSIAPQQAETYSPLRGTIRATFRVKVTVTTWKSGELRGGLAVLAIWDHAGRRFHGCYWMGPTGTLYAANGDAKTYSPNLPWAPVGIDFGTVMGAANWDLVEGAKRAMRARAQATLDAANER